MRYCLPLLLVLAACGGASSGGPNPSGYSITVRLTPQEGSNPSTGCAWWWRVSASDSVESDARMGTYSVSIDGDSRSGSFAGHLIVAVPELGTVQAYPGDRPYDWEVHAGSFDTSFVGITGC